MFLETLDVKSNDIVIFSQNRFEFENNYWLIRKNEKVKAPETINYFDVCEFIKNSIPKNIIVYRLLTNSTQMDAFSTKFGYFLNINGEMEIIYFDPIFALKDLNYLKYDGNTEQFRFKIQQLGLTSFSKESDGSFFYIVYSTELRANEAKYQNDKIFADAIFAFDENYNSKSYMIEAEFKNNKTKNLNISDSANIYTSNSKIIEVHENSNLELNKLDLPDKNRIENIREKKMSMLKEALGLSDCGSKEFYSSSNVLKHVENGSTQNEANNSNRIMKLFKSAEGQNIDKTNPDNFVLKIIR